LEQIDKDSESDFDDDKAETYLRGIDENEIYGGFGNFLKSDLALR
jgi:hypothetical protein